MCLPTIARVVLLSRIQNTRHIVIHGESASMLASNTSDYICCLCNSPGMEVHGQSDCRNALYGEAAECCGVQFQIPNWDPFFAFGVT